MFTLLNFSVLTGALGVAIFAPVSLLSGSSEITSIISSGTEPSVQTQFSTPLLQHPLISEEQDGVTEAIAEPKHKKLDECKEIGRSSIDGRLVACRDQKDEIKVKFSWYEHLFGDSIPQNLKSLKFTSSELVIELEEGVGYSANKRFDHKPEIFQRKGPILFTNGSSFKVEQCSVEWILGESQERIDWRVHCSSGISK